jgi:nucleoside-diphosphate-sugar epimerase
VRRVAGLPLVILRPALIYGPGDVAGLMPRVVVAATYTKIKARMDLL